MNGAEKPTEGPAPGVAPVEIVEPNLLAYYRQKGAKASAWVKAIRAAKSAGFSSADIDEALAALTDLDPDLAKTRALSELRDPPPAIERWVGDVWRQTHRRLADAPTDPMSSAIEQLIAIRTAVQPLLRSRKKLDRSFAENFIRLSLQLLLNKRELDAGETLRALNGLFRKGADLEERALRRAVRYRLPKARATQLSDLTLAFALAEALGTSARKELDDARSQILSLTIQLDAAKSSLAASETAVARERDKTQALQEELAQTRQHAHDNRQLGAHGQSEIKRHVRAFLVGTLEPLLADAVDASEGPRPYLDVVRERVVSAKAAVRGEIAWLDAPSG